MFGITKMHTKNRFGFLGCFRSNFIALGFMCYLIFCNQVLKTHIFFSVLFYKTLYQRMRLFYFCINSRNLLRCLFLVARTFIFLPLPLLTKL